jgi:hypothetical protein
MAFFTFSWSGAFVEAMKRVPVFMQSLPSASAATRLRPLGHSTGATKGIFSSSAAPPSFQLWRPDFWPASQAERFRVWLLCHSIGIVENAATLGCP